MIHRMGYFSDLQIELQRKVDDIDGHTDEMDIKIDMDIQELKAISNRYTPWDSFDNFRSLIDVCIDMLEKQARF